MCFSYDDCIVFFFFFFSGVWFTELFIKQCSHIFPCRFNSRRGKRSAERLFFIYLKKIFLLKIIFIYAYQLLILISDSWNSFCVKLMKFLLKNYLKVCIFSCIWVSTSNVLITLNIDLLMLFCQTTNALKLLFFSFVSKWLFQTKLETNFY